MRHIRTGLAACWAVSWLTLDIGDPAVAAQPPFRQLPRVYVNKDGRTFIDETGNPFVPIGVTYYRPGTGWAPQVWKQFDAEATRTDFARMKELGVNCVRVFLTYGSFYTEPGVLRPDGLAKFDRFLAIAEEAGVYVHPTGPDHWEGPPAWSPASVEDENTVQALASFWKLFAARYRDRRVIFAYDLRNEPEVGWNNLMARPWNRWLQEKYGSQERLKAAWGTTNSPEMGKLPVPPPEEGQTCRAEILDFQKFREELADRWTRVQAEAIKKVAPEALVSVGLIQWSVPSLLPAGPRHYSGFRPERQARYLDFLEVHFYPLARGAYDYQHEADELANLAYLQSVVREVAQPGKPVVLGEFGWYGGGKPKFDGGKHPAATQEQQAQYCRRVVETSKGFVTGWLNWGFYDQPEAQDCSEFTGLVASDGKTKAWGTTFLELSRELSGKFVAPTKVGQRPVFEWDTCLTSSAAANAFLREYLESYLQERKGR